MVIFDLLFGVNFIGFDGGHDVFRGTFGGGAIGNVKEKNHKVINKFGSAVGQQADDEAQGVISDDFIVGYDLGAVDAVEDVADCFRAFLSGP